MYFLKKIFEKYFDASYGNQSQENNSNQNTTNAVKAARKADVKKTE